MVSAAYDNIVAMVIIGVIFIGTVVALPAMTYTNLQTVDQQQLRNTAFNVFDSMLLDVGSPSNWGSNLTSDQTEVNRYGLARTAPFSKYVLDPDKVQRLDPNPLNPWFIEYDQIRSLMNITEYGFQFTLYRPFSVSWDLDVTETSVSFSTIITRTEDGTPIPNAEVRVTTMVTASKLPKTDDADFISVRKDPNTYYTNVKGVCSGSENFDLGEFNIDYAVAIMEINVAGLTTTVVAQNDNTISNLIKIYTFGDTITLSFPDNMNDTNSERRVKEIAAYSFDNMMRLFKAGEVNPPEIKITKGSGYEYWSITYPGLRAMNPAVLLFAMQLTLKGIGRTLVLIAGPFSLGDSEKIFSVGPDSGSENPIAIMRRLVVISDMTYVSEIAFWRE